ncbi:unnamed protein product [Schistosoma margrebowiei]|uniref:Uncharacterized protein n=1 Tax=Schistosoma margrebowiei TaxID=48269 RepID=A0A183LS39_9TREM|nr:unnamed protein product [Schistosoma margrebowiei]
MYQHYPPEYKDANKSIEIPALPFSLRKSHIPVRGLRFLSSKIENKPWIGMFNLSTISCIFNLKLGISW